MEKRIHNNAPPPKVEAFDPNLDGRKLGEVELEADRWLSENKNKPNITREEEQEIERVEVIVNGAKEAISLSQKIGVDIRNATFDDGLDECVGGQADLNNNSIQLNTNLVPESGEGFDLDQQISLMATVGLHEAGHHELNHIDENHQERNIKAIEGGNHLVTEQRNPDAMQFGIYSEEVSQARRNLTRAGESETALKTALDREDEAEVIRLMDIIEDKVPEKKSPEAQGDKHHEDSDEGIDEERMLAA
jgi:hypothetical protein